MGVARWVAGRRADPASIRAGALARGTGWVWPAWLERQLDPHAAAYSPGATTNTTARNWTAFGTIASPHRAVVDRAGLVTARPHGWSVDWWIGAEDRWHFPSREATVRQTLLGTEPVVETALRVPGGDAVARAYAVVGGAGLGDLAVIEVENCSAVPIAVAFAVRPYNAEGLAPIHHVEVLDDRIVVDRDLALLLPRAPAAAAASSFADGDVAEAVTSGVKDAPRSARCDIGMAQAVAIFPLAHRATIRVALPLGPATAASLPSRLPAAADVARAWAVQATRGLRVECPDGRLRAAFEANRRCVLEAFTGSGLIAAPSRPATVRPRDAVVIIGAMDRLGFHTDSAEILRDLPERQRFDGSFGRGRGAFARNRGGSDAAAAAIHAFADHWRLTGDRELLLQTLPTVGLAARWIARSRASSAGLVRTSDGPPLLGPSAHLYWDSWWGLRGLLDAAELLHAGGEPAAGAQCEQVAADLHAALDRHLASDTAMSAGPDRHLDVGAIGALVACEPLRLLGADDPRIVETARMIAARFCDGPAVAAVAGLSPMATMQLAAVELSAGDPRALIRLRWMVEASGPTFTWPDATHPTQHGGTAGEGHSLVVAAAFVTFVRNMLIDDEPGGLVILRQMPPEWRGEAIEVHDAPTMHGSLSYAVRWHGTRPALLWDLEPVAGAGPVWLRTPVLAPGWSTDAPRGETLLEP
ncbi:MAG: hypothetical protein ACYDH6_13490 [Acidimicrobiales bacterium]